MVILCISFRKKKSILLEDEKESLFFADYWKNVQLHRNNLKMS